MKIANRLLALVATTQLAFAADAPATFKVGEFRFQRPEKWAWVESTSAMRKAQLTVPSTDGKSPAEVVFFHFGPANGGGTQANVDRWLGQFQEKGGINLKKARVAKENGRTLHCKKKFNPDQNRCFSA